MIAESMLETSLKIVEKEMWTIYFINMAELLIYESNVATLLVRDQVDEERIFPTLLYSLKTRGNFKTCFRLLQCFWYVKIRQFSQENLTKLGFFTFIINCTRC